MTDKEFVLSIIPDAYVDPYWGTSQPRFVVRSATLPITSGFLKKGWLTLISEECNSSKAAWKSAAEQIRNEMIRKLEL